MYDKHWTDEELFDRLYEVRPEDDHLAQCISCAQRLDAMRGRYEKLRPPQFDVSPEFLAAQRRAIHARTHIKRHAFPRVLVPVVVTLLLVAFVIVHRPVSVKAPVKQPISDSELFNDVFNRISDPLPSSAGPIRSLFEERK
jgi:hypothetical protein